MRQSMGVREREFETLGSICDRLEVTRQFIWDKRRKGDFPPAVRLSSRAIRFRRAEVDEWLAERAER